jgi:sucrose-phosphate synthase
MTSSDGLSILSLSIHGLVRGYDVELGRDADTGGQVLYVLEQARALARNPGVREATLVTRQIFDRNVDESYTMSTEEIGEGTRIARVPFGPRRYLRKESLWPYLDGLVDRIVHDIRSLYSKPDVIHGHYADGGYVGAQLAKLLGVPFVFTGHSLGRVKQKRLLEKGVSSRALDRQFHFPDRIEAEEMALEEAGLVIASTTQEVEEQYELYDHYQPDRMEVIPPGVDLARFHAPRRHAPVPAIAAELSRFLRDPGKPIILTMARPDEKKNFPTLIRAYAECPELRKLANLVLVAGNRDEIGAMEPGARRVLAEILMLVDKYDLYGSVAYPKHHRREDVPDLYRLAARSKGVFVNAAVTEPFGLTLIEAAASGLPVVATRDGGPKDILDVCQNGILINPLDGTDIRDAVLEVLTDSERWESRSQSGIRNAHATYTWESHVEKYLREVRSLREGMRPGYDHFWTRQIRLPGIDRILVTSVDKTLTGDEEALSSLLELLEERGDSVGLAIATGRQPESALEILARNGVPEPDILITCVGTEIYYGKNLALDRSWLRHIDWNWNPDAVREAMGELPGFKLQKKNEQTRFKVSYIIDTRYAPSIREVRRYLRQKGLRVKVVASLGAYLDVTPIRASNGLAVRFLCFKWDLSPDRVLVAGDAGGDEDMLSGNTLGVVVGNYSSELEKLRGKPRVYFAEGSHARGILEGIEHYGFLDEVPAWEDSVV